MSQAVRRHMRACGVDGGAHRLRASCATRIVETTGDVQLAADLLGHQSLEHLAHYVTPSMRRLRSAVEAL